MARKLQWKFFRKFGYTSRDCSLFWKFWEMLFRSVLEVTENSNRTVCLNGKRPEFVFFDYEVFATVLRNECYFARSTGQIIANILSSPSDNRLLAFGKVHWRVNSRFLQVATEFSRAYHPSDVSAQTFSSHEFHMWWAWALWWSSRFLPVSQTLEPSVC